MKKLKKYTYDNWWNGSVILEYSERYTDKRKTIVQWDDFIKSDIQKIKDKQADIFKEGVSKLFKQHSQQFLKRYENSKSKKLLLSRENRQCLIIIKGFISNDRQVSLSHWVASLPNQYLSEVHDYIERTIIGGNDDGFDFVTSPNCERPNSNLPPSKIYADFIWQYYQWLSINFTTDSKIFAYQEKLWFQVAMFFASGEIDMLFKKYKKGTMANYSAIARELGNKNYRPYISDSFNGNKTDKNIFSNKKKYTIVIRYCKSNDIHVEQSFKDRFKQLIFN